MNGYVVIVPTTIAIILAECLDLLTVFNKPKEENNISARIADYFNSRLYIFLLKGKRNYYKKKWLSISESVKDIEKLVDLNVGNNSFFKGYHAKPDYKKNKKLDRFYVFSRFYKGLLSDKHISLLREMCESYVACKIKKKHKESINFLLRSKNHKKEIHSFTTRYNRYILAAPSRLGIQITDEERDDFHFIEVYDSNDYIVAPMLSVHKERLEDKLNKFIEREKRRADSALLMIHIIESDKKRQPLNRILNLAQINEQPPEEKLLFDECFYKSLALIEEGIKISIAGIDEYVKNEDKFRVDNLIHGGHSEAKDTIEEIIVTQKNKLLSLNIDGVNISTLLPNISNSTKNFSYYSDFFLAYASFLSKIDSYSYIGGIKKSSQSFICGDGVCLKWVDKHTSVLVRSQSKQVINIYYIMVFRQIYHEIFEHYPEEDVYLKYRSEYQESKDMCLNYDIDYKGKKMNIFEAYKEHIDSQIRDKIKNDVQAEKDAILLIKKEALQEIEKERRAIAKDKQAISRDKVIAQNSLKSALAHIEKVKADIKDVEGKVDWTNIRINSLEGLSNTTTRIRAEMDALSDKRR